MISTMKRSADDVHNTEAYKRRHRERLWRHVKRHGWWIALITLVLAEVVFQLAYPKSYTLPFAQYNHEPYGIKHQNDFAKKEQQLFQDAMVELRGADKVTRAPLRNLGAMLDENKSFSTLSNYPIEQRFIPFSILWQRPNIEKLPIVFADKPLNEYSENLATEYTVKPVDARLELKSEIVQLTEGRPGLTVSKDSVKQLIKKQTYNQGITRLTIPTVSSTPSKTAKDLEAVRGQAESIIAKQLTVIVKDKTYKPDKATIASWLALADDNGKTIVKLDKGDLNNYFDVIDKDIAKPAGITTVSIVDGVEQSREKGAPGEQLNRGEIEQKISSELFSPKHYLYVAGTMQPTLPAVKNIFSYSNSQAGLQAKVNEIGRRSNVRISIKQLDGAGWQAEYRGDESTPSASTYKLFVAMKLFDEMDKGTTNWDTPMLDTTVAGCFDRMIIISTNPCAEEWLRQFGRANVNEFLYNKGISRVTNLNSPDASRSSANDLRRAVEGIYTGAMAHGANRQKLLDMMSRQVWRKGIPAGTAGWTSDKVGFLWDYVHDTGVVHHPRGTYTLAVMTKGASYATIAQITRELEALMYP